jgi:pSer/pThr/pTyr-binding forkhead associated (FHA) protein
MGSLVLPSGERIYIGDAPVSIGRLPECTIAVNDSNISRRHAEVRAGTTAYVVVDLGSTNGTMLNGIKTTGEQRLSDGDIISVGSTHLRFEAS